MALYKFVSTMTIEAGSEAEAKAQFADESFDFAANADAREIEESDLSLEEAAQEYVSIISYSRDTLELRRHRKVAFKEGAEWAKRTGY